MFVWQSLFYVQSISWIYILKTGCHIFAQLTSKTEQTISILLFLSFLCAIYSHWNFISCKFMFLKAIKQIIWISSKIEPLTNICDLRKKKKNLQRDYTSHIDTHMDQFPFLFNICANMWLCVHLSFGLNRFKTSTSNRYAKCKQTMCSKVFVPKNKHSNTL